jgi:Low psii accumulation1 / Rep27
MTDLKTKTKNQRSTLDPEKYARLKAEAKAPYKGLRIFIYFAFGASGLIGALVFLAKLAAGNSVSSTLPNLVLQIGLVALTVFLFRLETRGRD